MSASKAAGQLETALADCRAILEDPAVATILEAAVATPEDGQGNTGQGNTTPPPGGPRWAPIVMVPIPGVKQLAAIAKPPLQVIKAVLAVIKAFADALAAILVGLLDPYRAIVLAAYEALRNLLNDLVNAGGYLYFDAPGISSATQASERLANVGKTLPSELETSYRAGQGGKPPPPPTDAWQRWAANFTASFDDPGDLDRPVFSSGASVNALFLVYAAPSLDALRQLLYLVGKLLNVDAWKLAWERHTPGPDPDRARAMGGGPGTAPNWQDWTLEELFPPVGALLAIPELLKKLLLAGDGLVALLKALATAIDQKIQVIQQIIDTIDAVLALLDALSALGLQGLFVTTNQGVAGLRQAFLTATNRPSGGYIGGVCLLAAGPGMKDATILYEMFGQGQAWSMVEDAWDSTRDKAASAWEAAKVDEAAQGLAQTAEQAAGDLAKAVVEAPAGVVESFAEAGQNVWDAAAGAPGKVVDALGQMKAELGDGAIAQGKKQVAKVRKRAEGSLAMGYGANEPVTASKLKPGGGTGGKGG